MNAPKKKLKPLIYYLKPTIYSLSALASIGLITYSMIGLSSAFGGFSMQVLLSPIRCAVTVLFIPTIICVLLGSVLIIVGIRKSKLWYLMPIGLIVIAEYCFFVIKMLAKLIER